MPTNCYANEDLPCSVKSLNRKTANLFRPLCTTSCASGGPLLNFKRLSWEERERAESWLLCSHSSIQCLGHSAREQAGPVCQPTVTFYITGFPMTSTQTTCNRFLMKFLRKENILSPNYYNQQANGASHTERTPLLNSLHLAWTREEV